MTGKTSIEWATAVWNPTTGCTRVSAGCDNCYAFALHDKRFASNLKAAHDAGYYGAKHDPTWVDVELARNAGVELPYRATQYDRPFSQVQLLEDRLDDPLRHRKPERYFVDSMADLFHEDVPDDYLLKVWAVMAMATWHTFLVLTKRPERMREFLNVDLMRVPHEFLDDLKARRVTIPNDAPPMTFPPANIWLGTSVEDQRAADERIPHLLATPAAVRFLSCEPLLGPVDLARWSWGNRCPDRRCGDSTWDHDCELGEQRLHWVIVGGESGARARPMDLAWARSLVQQCRAAGVAVFVKQLGSKPIRELRTFGTDRPTGAMHDIPLRDRKGGDMAEWPEDIRVREFPR